MAKSDQEMRERREAAIHVSWTGASEVRDLNSYFQNSPGIKEDLDFLKYLKKEIG